MPVWTPTLYVGTRHARYDALGSSLRGQITRETRPLFGSFNAVLTSAFVAGAVPEICACAQVVISSRFGSSLTGTAGDENWRSGNAVPRGVRATPGCTLTQTRQSHGRSAAPLGTAGENIHGKSGVANSTAGK